MSKRKIALISLSVFIVLLILIRLFLPQIVTNQVNKELADIDGYQGSIENVDLHLYRGAAKIFGLKIDKYDKDQNKTFINVLETEFSLEWKSLLKGYIVGEMTVRNPAMNFEITQNGEAEQTGKEVDWVTLVKDLAPIRINTFRIESATLSVDFPKSNEPQFDFDMDKINLLVTNITNVEDVDNPLPSIINITSNLSNYEGKIDVVAKANMLKKVPDMDMDMKLENINLETLNPFMEHYLGLDFNGGTLNLYSEVALKDGAYEGYLKPSLQDAVFF